MQSEGAAVRWLMFSVPTPHSALDEICGLPKSSIREPLLFLPLDKIIMWAIIGARRLGGGGGTFDHSREKRFVRLSAGRS